MGSPLRIGIIGAGFAGRDVHIPAWSRVPGATVVAVCDPDPEVRARVAALLPPSVPVFADHRALLAHGADAVSVCAPNLAHADVTADALRAGAHAFVEKPLAVTAEDVRRLGAEADTRGRVLAVRHQLRFDPGAEAARARARTIGPVRAIRARALRRDRIPTTPGLTDAALAGGGAALDLGVHVLDMAFWLADIGSAEVARARVTGSIRADYGRGLIPGYRNAWGDWDVTRFTVEDTASLRAEFPGGAVLSLESAWAGDFPEDEAGTWVELEGADGTLRWNAPPPDAVRPAGAPPDFLAFAESCRSGAAFPVTWREALPSIELLERFYKSVVRK